MLYCVSCLASPGSGLRIGRGAEGSNPGSDSLKRGGSYSYAYHATSSMVHTEENSLTSLYISDSLIV
jgi:hypothetical protein